MSKMTKKPKESVDITLDELQKLAHTGTKEALEKLQSLSEQDLPEETRAYVHMALEECEFFYYQPTNESEEHDMTLALMIRGREKVIERIETELEAKKEKEAQYDIDLAIHTQVIQDNPKKEKDWQYFEPILFSGDAIDNETDTELLLYQKEWIQEAKKRIKHEKYKTVPANYLDSWDLPDDDDECLCPDCIEEGGCEANCNCGCDAKTD
jgi:hypothetical protein